jgi:hypothetical protein
LSLSIPPPTLSPSSSLGDLLLYLSQNDVARLEPPLPIPRCPRADLGHPQTQLWLISLTVVAYLTPDPCAPSSNSSLQPPLAAEPVKFRRCSLMPPHQARGEPLPSQAVAASSRDQSQIEPHLCHTSPPSSPTLARCSKAGSHTSQSGPDVTLRCNALWSTAPGKPSLQPYHPVSSLMSLPLPAGPAQPHSQSNP